MRFSKNIFLIVFLVVDLSVFGYISVFSTLADDQVDNNIDENLVENFEYADNHVTDCSIDDEMLDTALVDDSFLLAEIDKDNDFDDIEKLPSLSENISIEATTLINSDSDTENAVSISVDEIDEEDLLNDDEFDENVSEETIEVVSDNDIITKSLSDNSINDVKDNVVSENVVPDSSISDNNVVSGNDIISSNMVEIPSLYEEVDKSDSHEVLAEDNVSSSNMFTSVNPDGTEVAHIMEVKNGITYVDGIMIVNKCYPLPSTYNPGGILPEVTNAFAKMQAKAAQEGLRIYISSGFRNYNRQVRLYNYYIKRDGKDAADTFSARPGYSEHQTGLTVDLNSISDSFSRTPEAKWVAEHAHEYGFIVRFPQGKEAITGYKYESWHLRYLGVENATKVYNSGLCLEEFLGVQSVYEN